MNEGSTAYGIELETLAARYYGSDQSRKPFIYLAEYDRIFRSMRNDPIRLLEVGVQRGISMQIWRDYFSAATVVGMDTSPKPEGFPTDSRFHFVRGAQQDPAAHDLALAAAGGAFDIIIADASHVGCFSALTVSMLFNRALKPGGIYVIEDICTAFVATGWDAEPYNPPDVGKLGTGIVGSPILRRVCHRLFSPGTLSNFLLGDPQPKVFPSHQNGMVGLVKQLMDHTMAPTATGAYTQFAIEKMTVLTNIAILHKAASS
jgi:SAM-dependent methyltransferase